MKKTLALGTFGLLMLASTSALAVERLVKGSLKYENYHLNTWVANSPIRDLNVNVKVGGTKVGSATTLSDGSFTAKVDSAKLPVGGTFTVEVTPYKPGIVDVYLDLDGQNHQLTWALPATTIPPGTGTITVPAYLVKKSNMSAHFNIADAIQYGFDWTKTRRDGGDSIGEVNVQYPDADWSNYSAFWGEITLNGPPSPWGYGEVGASEYGHYDSTILHEYGHRLEFTISDAVSSDEDHGQCTWINDDFSWKEGFPTYYAHAVINATPSLTTELSLETNPGCPTWATEGAVWSALWDIHDGLDPVNDPHDRMDGGKSTAQGTLRDILFKIFDKEMDAAYYVSGYNGVPAYWVHPKAQIHAFHDAFVVRNPYLGSHADLDRLLNGNRVPTHTLPDYVVSNVALPSGAAVTGAAYSLTLTLKNNTSFTYADLDVTVQVYTMAPTKYVLAEKKIAQFTGTKTVYQNVIMPSWFQQGYYPLWVEVDPADVFPEQDGKEVNTNSPQPNVYVAKCGDGVCTAAESCATCAADCGACCGNGTCESYWGETCSTCAGDCGSCSTCGDGVCDWDESVESCDVDCGAGGWN